MCEYLEKDKTDWTFIIGWYENILYDPGKLDWDYILQAAMDILPSEISKDPNHFSVRHLEIHALHNVSRLIREFFPKQSYLKTDRERYSIGGNNPPQGMQIEPQIVRETTIVWGAVDELKIETEKEVPDKSTVVRIIETLGRALKAILVWCARKGDLSVDTLIRWGIPFGGAAVLTNPKLVADVIEAAKAWVAFLP